MFFYGGEVPPNIFFVSKRIGVQKKRLYRLKTVYVEAFYRDSFPLHPHLRLTARFPEGYPSI